MLKKCFFSRVVSIVWVWCDGETRGGAAVVAAPSGGMEEWDNQIDEASLEAIETGFCVEERNWEKSVVFVAIFMHCSAQIHA